MGKSPISRSEAEKAGWVIVHEDEEQPFYRAEKFIDSNTKIEASGTSEGTLLEAINAQEIHRESLPEIAPAPVDESGAQLDEAGVIVRNVLVPDEERLTDAEWSSRDSGEAIIRGEDEEFQIEGATEAAARAEEKIQELSADAENEKTAEPDFGPTKQIEQESDRDHQLQDVLVVRKGEKSLEEVIDRKLEDSAEVESDRANAGLGIGPAVEPMGGPAEFFDPSELPGGVTLTGEQVQAREEAEQAKAEELRDEHGKAADKPEIAGEVAEAGAEAAQEVKDEAEGNQEQPPDEVSGASVEKSPGDSGGESVPVELEEKPVFEAQAEGDAPASQEQEVATEETSAIVDGGKAVEPAPGADQPQESLQGEQTGQPQEGGIRATEAAKKFAAEKGVDLSEVKGEGNHGKITKPDVESHLEAQNGS